MFLDISHKDLVEPGLGTPSFACRPPYLHRSSSQDLNHRIKVFGFVGGESGEEPIGIVVMIFGLEDINDSNRKPGNLLWLDPGRLHAVERGRIGFSKDDGDSGLNYCGAVPKPFELVDSLLPSNF